MQYKSLDELYTKPYTRAAQYITGVWTGCMLSKINRQWCVRKVSVIAVSKEKLRARETVVMDHMIFFLLFLQLYINLGWILSISTLVFLVVVQVYKETSFIISFGFPAFGRLLWSLPICFMVFAGSTKFCEGEETLKTQKNCVFKEAKFKNKYFTGFIANILNSKLLLPFSRMSFSAYLLNPLIVMILTFSCETSFHLDFFTLAIYICGFYVITYFAAYLFMLFFENPIIMFIRTYLR